MKLRSKITGTLVIALVIGGIAFWQMRKNSAPVQAVAPASTATNNTTASELLASNVSTLELQTLLHTLPVSGNLKALNTVTIKARAAGELLMLNGAFVMLSGAGAAAGPREALRRTRQRERARGRKGRPTPRRDLRAQGGGEAFHAQRRE
jgi:hypothetical protein